MLVVKIDKPIEEKLSVSKVERLYIDENVTRREIAKIFKVEFHTINNFMVANGITKTREKQIKGRYIGTTQSPVMDSNTVSVEQIKEMAKKR